MGNLINPKKESGQRNTFCLVKTYRYSWTSSEVEEAQRASVLIAADVIYSDDLTDALFNALEGLMSQGSEKVPNNTVD